MRIVLSIVCVCVLGLGLGCAALSEYVTPATVDQGAVQYAASAGAADPNSFAGFANLEKAIRLETAVENAYEIKTLALNQMAEKNQLDYGILRGVVTNNSKVARQREERLFGETGLLSMGLSLLGVGGLGGVIGLMRKRPGDVTPQEMEFAVADIKGEVTDKDRQIIEIVKGVQTFLTTHVGDDVAAELKTALGTAQSADTKQVIAVAKTTLT